MSQNATQARTPTTIEERIGGSVDRTVTAELSVIDTGGGGTLAFSSMGEVLEFSKVMAISGIAVRKHLRGNAGACAAITMQAMRWNMDPFAVANKSYAVSDQIAYESQLIAAVVNTRAPLRERLRSRYEGDGEKRKCIVFGTLIGESEPREVPSPEIGKITPKNSPLWKTDPDQQLFYYTVRLWARRETPEILLGVYDPEELAEARALAGARDITPAATPQALLEQAGTQAQDLADRAAAINAQGADEDPEPEASNDEHPYPEHRFDMLDDDGVVVQSGLTAGPWATGYDEILARLETSEAVEGFIKANSSVFQTIHGEGLLDDFGVLAEAQQKARDRVAPDEEPEGEQEADSEPETAEEPSAWAVHYPSGAKRSSGFTGYIGECRKMLDTCKTGADFTAFLEANGAQMEGAAKTHNLGQLRDMLDEARANAG